MRELIAEGLGYPEGPLVLSDGRVLVADIRNGVILSVSPSGAVDRFAVTRGGPNGLAMGSQGQVCCVNNGGLEWSDTRALGPAADYKSGSLQLIGPDGRVSAAFTSSEAGTLVAPNDVAVDSQGGIWFTDSGRGLNGARDAYVYYADPAVERIVVAADGYRFSNGLAFLAGESELIVAESGTGELWIHPVIGPGKLGPQRLFATMTDNHRPDGICIDVEGNVVVAGVLGSGVVVYDASGVQIERFAFETRLVTNVAFGGADLTDLYVTESWPGQLWRIPWRCPGLPLPFRADREATA